MLKLLMFIALTAGAPAEDTLEQAEALAQSGENAAAYAMYRRLAEAGNDAAQFNVGAYHANGEVVDYDPATGLAWIYLSLQPYEAAGRALPWQRRIAVQRLESALSEEVRVQARERAKALYQAYGSGTGVGTVPPLVVMRFDAPPRGRCDNPGTHIKKCGMMQKTQVETVERVYERFVDWDEVVD